ncbi:MAG: hypothetical protein WAV41_04290 [Microgenomates group bacterium]
MNQFTSAELELRHQQRMDVLARKLVTSTRQSLDLLALGAIEPKAAAFAIVPALASATSTLEMCVEVFAYNKIRTIIT